jgi:hypothetical protein
VNRREFNARAGIIGASLLVGGGRELLNRERAAGSMWIYLWDLADEGYDSVLARMKESGMESLSLAAAYHAGKFLAPHNPKHKVVYPEDGVVYFQPSSKHYKRIRPVVSKLIQEGHSLASVKRSTDKQGMKLNAWVVCCHNTALGLQYPDIACVTAFGDRIPQNVCPSHPDVRAYLRGMVGDIAHQGVGRIELEALQFQGYVHGFHHEREGIPLSSAARFLLGLCFCPSCIRSARNEHVEMEQWRQYVVATLSTFFERPEETNDRLRTPDDLPVDLLQPFQEWRQRVIVSLVSDLMEQVHSTGVQLRPLVSIDPSARAMAGMNAARVTSVTGGMVTPGYVRNGTELRDPLRNIQKLAGSQEIIVGQQVGLPESGGRAEFLSRVLTARELGVNSFNFYHYGFIPYSRLEWIRESLS